MTRSEQNQCSGIPRLAGMATLLFMLLTAIVAQAQTFTVLHTFSGPDGAYPSAAPTLDRVGNLYGPTISGTGAAYNGTIFKLSYRASGWVLSSLYEFRGGNDGENPHGGVTFDQNGILYGTTLLGGGGDCYPNACGAVFKLRPPANVCRSEYCPWGKTQLYAFQEAADGAGPNCAVVFDQAGNIYGTTEGGGTGLGVVYELTSSGDGWTENVPHSFIGPPDGAYPTNVISDSSGNLYGTTTDNGPFNLGTIFRLTPSGSGWTFTVLYAFEGSSDGGFPYGGVMLDQSGNLYGTTTQGGAGGNGTIYQLTPQGGSWTYNVLYFFPAGSPAPDPTTLAIDAAGNLYGVTSSGGRYSTGSVFKLTHSGSGWTFTSLYDFTGGSAGEEPIDTVVLDTNGNIYGAAYYGGNNNCENGCGTIWEITP